MREEHGITRRNLLKAAAAASLAPLAAGLGGCGKPGASPKEAGRVMVVGGGLCGLVVLDRLRKAGRDAVLFEAGNRLGGRIYTVRDGMPAGLRAEMGAERVGVGHAGLRALLQELEITTLPYPSPTRPFEIEWNGARHRFRSSDDLPKDLVAGLSDVERAAAPFGVLDALVAKAGTPPGSDATTALAWLRSAGMTPRGEWFVRAFTPLPLSTMPATVFHRVMLRDQAAVQSDAVAGGTDRIVEALATRHAAAITRGALVERVRQTESRVELNDGGGPFVGSHAVFCLPLARLRALAMEGGTPPELEQRFKVLEPAYEIKIAKVSEKEFDARHPDAAEFTLAERRVSWRLPEVTEQGQFVTQSLAWEKDAARPAGFVAPAGSTAKDFATDPLIGAAYAYATSGSAPDGIVRAGRLVFAGADLSDMPGWMEGAVRAADQAVAAVTS